MTSEQNETIVKVIEALDTETRETIEPLQRAYTEHIEHLERQVKLLNRALYGRSSEKMPSVDDELRKERPLPEKTVDGLPMPKDEKKRAREHRRHSRKDSEPRRKKNREAKKELPTEDVEIPVHEDQLPDGLTLDDFRAMGGEPTIVERTEWVPGRFVRFRYFLQAIVSRDGKRVLRAKPPRGVGPGVHYGPGLHAHVVTSKCADSQPLHRISRSLGRSGVHMPRSTVCSLFHRVADELSPLYSAILDEARRSSHLHADETTLPVQKPGGCKKGWVWTCVAPNAIAYRFDASRGSAAAKELLGDAPDLGTDADGSAIRQKLCIDGYSGYNAVTGDDGRVRCGCWSHARRNVFEALSSAPQAKELLDLIRKLFKVERDAANADEIGTKKHLARRKRESAPLVKEIYEWVKANTGADPPSHPLSAALTYLTNQRASLEHFLEDPKVPLDNNIAERILRIIAIGRKNFLFAGTDAGAKNLALLQSIVATCLLHGVNPETYIADVLVRIRDTSPVEALLPWNWVPAA